CPVLQTSAVAPGTSSRCQQFVQQIAVALLDIYELKADALREFGGSDIMFRQGGEIVIRKKRIVGTYGGRVEDWIMEGDLAPAIAVAAGVRQLQADEEILIGAKGLAMRLAALAEHALKVGSCSLV